MSSKMTATILIIIIRRLLKLCEWSLDLNYPQRLAQEDVNRVANGNRVPGKETDWTDHMETSSCCFDNDTPPSDMTSHNDNDVSFMIDHAHPLSSISCIV